MERAAWERRGEWKRADQLLALVAEAIEDQTRVLALFLGVDTSTLPPPQRFEWPGRSAPALNVSRPNAPSGRRQSSSSEIKAFFSR